MVGTPVHVNDTIRLKTAFPYAGLRPGDAGVVSSVWRLSPLFYEVEFHPADLHDAPVRILCREEQIERVAGRE